MQAAITTLALDTGGSPLTFVVFGAVIFSLVISLLMVVTRGTDNMYDHIGAGGFSREEGGAGLAAPSMESAADRAERED